MRRIGGLFAYIAIFVLSLPITGNAGVWEQDGPGWKYKREDGTYIQDAWEWIDGNGDWEYECYYFNGNGHCLQGAKTPDGYAVNSQGAWTENGIVQKRIQIDPEYVLCVLTDEMLTP